MRAGGGGWITQTPEITGQIANCKQLLNSLAIQSKNVAAKKLCGGVVALKILRKLTCNS